MKHIRWTSISETLIIIRDNLLYNSKLQSSSHQISTVFFYDTPRRIYQFRFIIYNLYPLLSVTVPAFHATRY